MSSKGAAYTRGSIERTMIMTALSMIPATLAGVGYNIIDTYFVSRLGTLPLAAMGFTFPMIMLVGCVCRGIATGSMTPLAHALGSRKSNQAAEVASAGLLLIFIYSLLVAVIGYFTVEQVFTLFGASAEVRPMVNEYMRIWYLGYFAMSMSMLCNDLLVGSGSPKVASLMIVGGMALNLILDPIFIFGWGPIPAGGIRGAAWATVISQFLSMLVMMLIVHFRYRLLTRRIFHFDLLIKTWKVIIRIAIPSMLSALMMPIGGGIVVKIVAGFGTDVVAGFTAARRLEMLAFVIPMAFGRTMVPVIAQNYGAKFYDRINRCRKFGISFAAYFELGMAVVFFIFAPQFSALFSDDPKVIEVMTAYMRIIPFGFGMLEIHRYSTFVCTGCNRASASAWLNFIRLFGLLVPFYMVALYFHSLNGLMTARLIADLLSGGIGIWYARKIALGLYGTDDRIDDDEIMSTEAA